MPFAAKRPCGKCGRLASGRYCEGCRAKGAEGPGRAIRRTAAQRGYGYRWQKASAAYLREHPRCADPDKVHGEMVVPSAHTDHKTPHKGDMQLFWKPDNWQALCHSCHSRKTALEAGFGIRDC